MAALAGTTAIDLSKRLCQRQATPQHDLHASQLFTVLWDLVAIGFAVPAARLDDLIEAVNSLGSIVYRTALGRCLVWFFVRRVTPVLIAALVALTAVAALFFAWSLGFLWFTVIGCGIVVGPSLLFESLREGRRA